MLCVCVSMRVCVVGGASVIGFKVQYKTFAIRLCKYFQKAKSHRMNARQMNCCNQYEFPFFSLPLPSLIACCLGP